MAAKKSTDVMIAGKIYTLSGYEEEGYLQRVASYINAKISEITDREEYRRIPNDMKSMLIQLNIADDYFKAKSQFEGMEENYKKAEKELFELKHELVDTQMKVEELLSKLDHERRERNQKTEREQQLEEKLRKLNEQHALLSDRVKVSEEKNHQFEEMLRLSEQERRELDAVNKELRLSKEKLESALADALLGAAQNENDTVRTDTVQNAAVQDPSVLHHTIYPEAPDKKPDRHTDTRNRGKQTKAQEKTEQEETHTRQPEQTSIPAEASDGQQDMPEKNQKDQKDQDEKTEGDTAQAHAQIDPTEHQTGETAVSNPIQPEPKNLHPSAPQPPDDSQQVSETDASRQPLSRQPESELSGTLSGIEEFERQLARMQASERQTSIMSVPEQQPEPDEADDTDSKDLFTFHTPAKEPVPVMAELSDEELEELLAPVEKIPSEDPDPIPAMAKLSGEELEELLAPTLAELSEEELKALLAPVKGNDLLHENPDQEDTADMEESDELGESAEENLDADQSFAETGTASAEASDAEKTEEKAAVSELSSIKQSVSGIEQSASDMEEVYSEASDQDASDSKVPDENETAIQNELSEKPDQSKTATEDTPAETAALEMADHDLALFEVSVPDESTGETGSSTDAADKDSLAIPDVEAIEDTLAGGFPFDGDFQEDSADPVVTEHVKVRSSVMEEVSEEDGPELLEIARQIEEMERQEQQEKQEQAEKAKKKGKKKQKRKR